ncbi:hypothetical protein PG988_014681 [Apiospora saccharicola]
MTENHAGLSPALVETVAGLSAGSIATLVVHPLDIVKTRMQLHPQQRAHLVEPDHYPVQALYRGLTPNLLGNATSWASFFFFKARIERAIGYMKAAETMPDGTSFSAEARSSRGRISNAANLTASDYFISSGLAGVGVQILTNPIWVMKVRMLASDRGAVGAYPSMLKGAAQLWKEEGLRGFYRGLGISLLGVTHGAVQFAVYDSTKRMYFARQRQQLDDLAPTRLSNEATVVLSSASKLIAGAVTYPYQAIRSRLQTYDADQKYGRGIMGVVKRTWTEEGLRGFYRGIVPGVIRVLPATWVTFLVYENVKFHLPKWTS